MLTGGYGGKPIIRDVSFDVEKGEFFGILGPNGSGKTTLLKMLSGILPFDEGEIVINEAAHFRLFGERACEIVAVLPQHAANSFSYTVKETVSLGRYAHQKGLFHAWTQEDETSSKRR